MFFSRQLPPTTGLTISRQRFLNQVACLLFLTIVTSTLAETQERLFYDTSKTPDQTLLAAFNLCIVEPTATIDLDAGHQRNARFLARVYPLQLTPDPRVTNAAEKTFGPLPARLDPQHPAWPAFARKWSVELAAARGFDGIVLCGLDSANPADRSAIARWIADLDGQFPDKRIFVEDSYQTALDSRRFIDGFVRVGLTSQTNRRSDKSSPSSPEQTAALERQLDELRRLGIPTYAVDFAEEGDRAQAASLASRLEALGCTPFITTATLQGVNLGPWLEPARTLTVLFSGPENVGAEQTLSARWLHAPLEWLGYRLEYLNTSQLSIAELAAHCDESAGVILDAQLQLPLPAQNSLTALVQHCKARGIPLLLTGIPWTTPESFEPVSQLLSLEGTGQLVQSPQKVSLTHIEASLQVPDRRIQSPSSSLRRLSSGKGAEVLLSVRGEDRQAQPFVFHQAAITSWGGIWIEPLMQSVGPQIDPLRFLEKWLAHQPKQPVLDTATLSGRRLLVSRIHSTGFTITSRLRGLPTCAEVMRDEVLARYAIPFTVGVCEAELRGWLKGQETHHAMRNEQIARSIFAMANVEAASSSFSRPSTWTEDPLVETALSSSAPETQRGLNREIGGSLSFIQRRLLPAEKHVQLMMWPEGAAPTREALAYCEKINIESLATSPSTPALLLAAASANTSPPMLWMQQDQPRITAGSQTVADTSERIPSSNLSPSPVFLNFHFADVRDAASLAAITRTLDAVTMSPMHAITGAHFASLVRDASTSRIFQKGADRWVIVNAGTAQTLRLPATAGVPNLSACRGIAGWKVEGDQIYIHTMGRPSSELVMTQNTVSPRLHLVEAGGLLQFAELGSQRALFQVTNWCPVEVVFAGIAPHSTCTIISNGSSETVSADARGQVTFTVPSRAAVQLQVMPENYAVIH